MSRATSEGGKQMTRPLYETEADRSREASVIELVMVSYIIVTRNPTSKKLMIIEEADPAAQYNGAVIAEFATEDEAYEHAETLPVCRAWGAEIVPLGGLGEV